MTQEEASKKVASYAFRQNGILKGKAFVTSDGMIFIPHQRFEIPQMAVDVNGQKGPNKWGTDIHVFVLKRTANSMPQVRPGGNTYLLESGGVLTSVLLDLK